MLLSMPIGSGCSLTLLLTRVHLIVQMFTTHLVFSSVALRKEDVITAQTVHAATFVFMHDKVPFACSSSDGGSTGAQ